jgi:hypothetical protein
VKRWLQHGRLVFTLSRACVYIRGMVTHEHGTRARYGAGCRCRRCKRAWREYITSRRRAKGQPDRDTAKAQRDVRHTRAIVQRAVENGEDDVELPLALSPLGGQILAAIQQRTGRRRDVVIDELLREHGAEIPLRESQRS